ncbi:hsp70-binding protein 1-like [Dermacentor andersoni]|uniref:hsp70-binding protein 1-like n=1 Tax=Dermacentor andersoni TaxID=34620 RepID=UPI002417B4D6|nr:hsp70-binding protein 1-like [Dermacentor andersoni]
MAEDVAQPAPSGRAVDPQRLDVSRIRWLTRAMQELLVNPYDEMRRSLRNIRECLHESHNVGRVLVACIANLQQYIDVVDYAKDFEKMGGFQVFPELLDYPSSLVRVETCALIAELVQNNPHCQRAALLSASRLLRLLNTETDDEVRCKALYALSCMVRQNKDAYANFEKLGGPVVLRRILFETTNRRLKTKASFLVAALCSQEDGFRAALADSEFACDAVRLLPRVDGDCRQFLLSALLTLATHSVQPLLAELPTVREALVATLAGFIREHGDAAEFQEEVQYSTEILDLLKDRGELPRIICSS